MLYPFQKKAIDTSKNMDVRPHNRAVYDIKLVLKLPCGQADGCGLWRIIFMGVCYGIGSLNYLIKLMDFRIYWDPKILQCVAPEDDLP
jgi:hypothetical protein